MRTTAIAASALTLLSAASARLTGVAVPKTIKAGDTFNAVMLNEIYIQSVYDVAVAFGTAPPPAHPDWIGTVAGSQYLGPALSNQSKNLNVSVTLPASLPAGDQVFYAALYSLYGASSGPTISTYSVQFTVGDETSDEYVSSNAA